MEAKTNQKTFGAPLFAPLFGGLYYLSKLRIEAVARRKKDYREYLVPLIGELRKVVLNFMNDTFLEKHLNVLGEALSDRREMLLDCPKIMNYNKEFMDNYAELFRLLQSQKMNPEERPINLLKLKHWFLKQEPKKIQSIYSEYYRWYKK